MGSVQEHFNNSRHLMIPYLMTYHSPVLSILQYYLIHESTKHSYPKLIDYIFYLVKLKEFIIYHINITI